jgi:hypothetical protein
VVVDRRGTERAADVSFGATVHPGLAVADVVWSPLITASGATILGLDSSGFAVRRVTRPKMSFTSQVTPPVLAGLILTFGRSSRTRWLLWRTAAVPGPTGRLTPLTNDGA